MLSIYICGGIILGVSVVFIATLSLLTYFFNLLLSGLQTKKYVHLKGVFKLICKPINSLIDKYSDKIGDGINQVAVYGRIALGTLLTLAIVSAICAIIVLIFNK